MKRLFKLLAVAIMVFGLAVVGTMAQNSQVNSYILQSPTLAQAQSACQTYGLTLVSTIHSPDTYLVQASAAVPAATLIQWTKNDPNVKHLQLNTKISVPENQLTAAPYVPTLPSTSYATGPLATLYGMTTWLGYAQQPAIYGINGATTIQPTLSGQGIIAVIDTGVDPTNTLLAPVLVPGYDFTANVAGYASELGDVNQSTAHVLFQSTAHVLFQSTAHVLFSYQAVPLTPSTTAILDSDTASALHSQQIPNDFGHGTMVAGLIHLVAPKAQIMPLKAFMADGTADESNIVAAIYYAADHGASVINMSFGFPQISDAMMKAVNYATRKGVVCVASVGNDQQTALVYPAAFGNVIGVASVSQQNQPSSFTNYGPDLVTVAAPGEALVTTYPGNHYAAAWGTSFSAALVSGSVDLLIQAAKDNLTSQLGEADYARALKHANGCVTDGSLGAGCMDLNQAVKFIQSVNMQAPPPTN